MRERDQAPLKALIPNSSNFSSTRVYVMQVLRESIIDGSIPSGTQLRQEEVARRLGVSPTPVREALRELESFGFVSVRPNRGAIVSKLSSAEVLEIYEIRCFLEVGAMELAYPHLNEEVFNKASSILDSLEKETGFRRWCEINWDFHSIFYAPAGRPRLLSMIRTLYMNADRYFRIYLSKMEWQNLSSHEHRDLVGFLKSGDLEGAKGCLRYHLLHAGQLIGDYLAEQEKSEIDN